jgi:hypothetical protein
VVPLLLMVMPRVLVDPNGSLMDGLGFRVWRSMTDISVAWPGAVAAVDGMRLDTSASVSSGVTATQVGWRPVEINALVVPLAISMTAR